jgi:hypothetical protein
MSHLQALMIQIQVIRFYKDLYPEGLKMTQEWKHIQVTRFCKDLYPEGLKMTQ